MSQITKEITNFEASMRVSDKLSDTSWQATSDKRKSIIIPLGCSIYDLDEKKFYNGDGSSYGGVSAGSRSSIRNVALDAAADTGLSVSATTDKVTWTTKGAYLRTGDAVTFAAGSGTLPTGISATTYYIRKDTDDPDADSFQLFDTRAHAVATGATTGLVNITTSGVPGWTNVISTLTVDGTADLFLISTVGVAGTVYLPYPTTAAIPRVTIKRAKAGNFTVTIAALNSSNAAATLTWDDTAANISLASGTLAESVTLIGDPTSHNYFCTSRIVN